MILCGREQLATVMVLLTVGSYRVYELAVNSKPRINRGYRLAPRRVEAV